MWCGVRCGVVCGVGVGVGVGAGVGVVRLLLSIWIVLLHSV